MLAARPQPGRVGTIAASLAADVEAGTAKCCEPDVFSTLVSMPPEDSEPANSSFGDCLVGEAGVRPSHARSSAPFVEVPTQNGQSPSRSESSDSWIEDSAVPGPASSAAAT